MNELNKKLAEWAGFREEFELETGVGFWVYPDGKGDNDLPNFPNSLDACFKWFVPDHDITCIMFIYTDDEVICKVEVAWNKEYEGVAEIGKDALALCLAIEKLIDGEKDVRV